MTIAVVNDKGGMGKTNTTINPERTLATGRYSVLPVGFDAQSSLTYSLGVDDNNDWKRSGKLTPSTRISKSWVPFLLRPPFRHACMKPEN